MIIDCIADLHGYYPELEGGDLLIVAGDLTARDTGLEYDYFVEWILKQNYSSRIVIPGNHDNNLQRAQSPFSGLWDDPPNLIYLCDSGTEFEGLKIWGSPWTKTFEGINPKCKAFTCDTEDELAEKWLTCPNDVDILITHSPPLGILDTNVFQKECGSNSLRNLMFKVKPSLMIFGHIHECGGKSIDLTTTFCVNASHVNEKYQPQNKAIRIEFDTKNKRAIRLNKY